MVEHLVLGLAGEPVRAGLADGVDLEAAGAEEVDRVGATLDDVDRGDVVRGRLSHEHTEQRHGDVRAVEQVDVRLAATARARATDCVL